MKSNYFWKTYITIKSFTNNQNLFDICDAIHPMIMAQLLGAIYILKIEHVYTKLKFTRFTRNLENSKSSGTLYV